MTVAMTPQPPTPQRRARETTEDGGSSHRAGGFGGPHWPIPAIDKAGMRV